MSTKTKEKPGAVAETLPTFQVPIRSIRVLEQHRRHFDEKKLKELAGSIAKVNVLQALLLRQDPEDPALYILVAGERRLRAAKLAGLETVPARVGPWNEQEAAEVQAFENLHRADLTPIEEARAFKTLKDVNGHDVEALAQRVDKSEAYVYRALALLELPAGILKEIEDGDLTPAHGHQLMRVPPKERETVYKEWREDFDAEEKNFTALSLREFVESRQNQDLDKAVFPKNVPYAGQMACAGCGFNSGNQGQLFDGAEKGKCLNAPCFNIKTEAARTEVGEKALKSFPGVQLAGVVERNHEGLPMVKGVIITEKTAGTKKLKDLAADFPAKFSMVVAKEQSYGDNRKPGAFLVCKDREFLEKNGVVTKAVEKPRESSPQLSMRETPQEKHVKRAVEVALIKAAAETYRKAGPRAPWLDAVVNRLKQRWDYNAENLAVALKVLDIEIPKTEKDYKAIHGDDLKAIIWMLTIHDSMRCSEGPDRLKKLGVDVAKVKKDAAKAANAEWALQQADKKPGKKDPKGAPDAEEEDPDQE